MNRQTSSRKNKLTTFAVLAAAGALWPAASVSARSSTGPVDPYAYMPATMVLNGVVRDFKYYGTPGGHVDFERYSGRRTGLLQNTLDSEGKPVLASTKGSDVSKEYKNAAGLNINPASYKASLGDVAGSMTAATTAIITSADSFKQWFRDCPGINVSMNVPVTLGRVPNTNMYRVQMEDDPATNEREGFFPIDGKLFGDMDATYHHNFSFTYELATKFEYKRGTGQQFTFTGDDDVWVFIDGKLAIDLGGVHSAIQQTVDLDRFADANGLVTGNKYELKFLYAERHTTRSNIRIETTLELISVQKPAVTGIFD